MKEIFNSAEKFTKGTVAVLSVISDFHNAMKSNSPLGMLLVTAKAASSLKKHISNMAFK